MAQSDILFSHLSILRSININALRGTSPLPLAIRFIRFIRLLLHIVSGLIQSTVYPHFNQPIQHRMMQNWAIKFLKILNIHLNCHGRLPTIAEQRVLFVANHVSWLDICVLMAACPTRFVAKSEIGRWPIIGLLCKNVGTLFIQRAKRSDTLRINQNIDKVLKTGDRVTIFPEGTTSDGTRMHHFHASLLQSAVTADTLLYPIAISYHNMAGEISQEAAYVELSLLQSLQQILSQPKIDATIKFIEPISNSQKNRRELARLTEQTIASVLSLPVVRKEPEKHFDLPST